MCGIAGFVDFTAQPASYWEPILSCMHAAIQHRGPDGWGCTVLSGDVAVEHTNAGTHDTRSPAHPNITVGLAHARLAIIDLSQSAQQPMPAADRTAWLTYNGEIYNYAALRAELIARGVPLRSTSDTEVLNEWLRVDGADALGRMRGMFAFAWWDARGQRLLLARDRFGIKPLVYAQPTPGVWVFASTPAAIWASGLVPKSSADNRAAEFLRFGSIDVRHSFWSGIDVVAPGACVQLDAAGATARQYWNVDRVLLDASPAVSAVDAARTIERAIVDSVRAHLVSDVPVAVFLSGGLDSTALLAAARAAGVEHVRTFTVTMPGQPIDESADARRAAETFGADHVEVPIEAIDLDSSIDDFFSAMQTPTVDGFNTFLIARAARQAGLKVALSGVGGDELFGGYPGFVDVPRLLRCIRALGPLSGAVAAAARMVPNSQAAKLAQILEERPRRTADVWRAYRSVFSRRDAASLAGAADVEPEDEGRESAGIFALIRLLETTRFLESQLLGDADAFTMCGALELRTPFVDHVLFEAVAAAGVWNRGARETYKQTLFRQMPALTMPGAVGRAKQGFVLPFADWIREALTAGAPSRLGDLRRRLSRKRYAPFVTRFLAGRLHWSRIWALYVFDRVTTPA